jgi:hypothetical protein
MQIFIFDVMDGPSLEFSERVPCASLAAALRHARQMAGWVPDEFGDVEGWQVRICNEAGFVIMAVDVAEEEAAPAMLAPAAVVRQPDLAFC